MSDERVEFKRTAPDAWFAEGADWWGGYRKTDRIGCDPWFADFKASNGYSESGLFATAGRAAAWVREQLKRHQ